MSGGSFGLSDWMKEATPLAYTRISSNDQDKTDLSKKNAKSKPILKKQFDFIQKRLKADGLPEVKAENWFAEVGSGADRNRGQWKNVIRRAVSMAAGGEKVFIVVQDPSRWARNARHAMVAIDQLHDVGVPVYAARESLQTGSVGDLHPIEELIFVQLLGSAAFVSQEQSKKALQSVDTAKEEGKASSTGYSLFPFAKVDPLDAYYEHIAILRAPKDKWQSGQGGPNAWATVVAATSAPNGPTVNSVKNTLRKAEQERREKLSDKEYKAWREYRTMIRNILKERNADPWAPRGVDSGTYDFGAQALMMMVSRSLSEPWKYRMRTAEEIEEYLTNPKPYLSVKDSKIYKTTVSKR
jgi:DNA invertase Pin-like site-specific DNA recombinase